LDVGVRGDIYYPSAEEIAGIERGLRAAEEGRVATEQEVEAVFDKHSR
jgi:predicted transcriptional regulator